MATQASTVLTLSDWAKRLDPNGQVPTIVELLSQTNEILIDKLYKEGNLPTGDRTTVRTGLPTVAWRLLNQGVQPSKSTTAQIDEATGTLEAWSEVDKKLADLNGNTNAFRLSEAQAFIEAMNQEMASTLFYGNSSTAPEEFTGFSVRYGDLSATNAQNIISGGGTGSDNSSIWLVVWGPNTVYGIFPKGSKAGLVHNDFGEVTVETSAGIAGTRLRAYQEQWIWNCGIALRDWRYVVRIPNIDISDLSAEASAANLIKLMIRAIHRIPAMGLGKPAFYMNRTCMQMLDIQRYNIMTGGGAASGTPNGGSIQYGQVDGVWSPSFRGIPLRKVDALTETEAQVT